MRTKLLAAMLMVASPAFAGEALFKYKGKTYEGKDLPPAQQQQLHDIELEHHARLSIFVDQTIYDLYLDDEAKKTGKSRADVEASLFKITEPTDKQIQDWYEANKNRLPPGYQLEQIKGDIAQLLKGEAKKRQLADLIARLKKDGTLSLTLAEPAAPQFTIDTSGYPVKGKVGSKVTLVEFADYQCPHCKLAGKSLSNLMKKFDGKVSLVFIDFPIKGEVSLALAHGGVCADQQGKYWEYNDLAFERQGQLDKDAPFKLAKDLKLDEAKFRSCYDGSEPAKRVARAKAEGDKIGLTGTPSIFLNGRRVRGYEEHELEAEIERALKGNS